MSSPASVQVKAFKVAAKGTPKHKHGQMNSTECAYAERLEILKVQGLVSWFVFESVKLRLADLTFYTPDFAVMLADGTLEMHEVKGFWQDDARVKIKVAAEMYPLVFRAFKPRAKKHGGGWEEEVFGAAKEST